MQKIYQLLIPIVIGCGFLALWSQPAGAVTYKGSAGGGSYPSISDPSPLKIWDLRQIRAEGRSHALPWINQNYRGESMVLKPTDSVDQLNWTQVRRILARRDAWNSRILTGYLLRFCNTARGNCPLWSDESRRVGSRRAAAYHTHRAWNGSGDSKYLGPKATLAFNIRIWREDPRNGQFRLIFKRSVGGDDDAGGITDGAICRRTTLIASLQNWWGGCKPRSGIGPVYTAANSPLSAGPLGPSQGAVKRQCSYPGNRFNPREGARGNRDIRLGEVRQGDGSIDTIWYPPSSHQGYARSGVIPRLADFSESAGGAIKNEGDCYWEGNNLARDFAWEGRSGVSARNTILHFIRKKTRASLPRGASIGPDNQFGAISPTGGRINWVRNRSGVVGQGLKEAVWLRWRIPNKKGRASLDYRIEGVPGLAYAVHITRISPKEELQNIRKPDGAANTYYPGEQYFKAYIPNVLNGDDGTESFVTAPPVTETDLKTPDFAVINQNASLDLEVKVEDGGDTGQQFAFPRETSFWHYTPQSKYSRTPNAPALSPNLYSHVLYQNLCTTASSGDCYRKNFLPVGNLGLQGNPTADPAKGPEYLTKLTKSYDGIDLLSDSIFNQNLGMSWSEPTLANPCPEGVIDPSGSVAGFDKTAPWLQSTRNTDCSPQQDASGNPISFANSWDDMIDAETKLDLVWPGLKDRENTYTVTAADRTYKEVELRCPGTVHELMPGQRCGRMDSSVRPEGYFQPAEGTGSVRVNLDVDQPGNLDSTGIELYPRGTDSPAASVTGTNPLSGKLELNLCNPGTFDSPRDIVRPRTRVGDPNCQGPAANWNFEPGNNEDERIERCHVSRNLPPARSAYIGAGLVLGASDPTLQSPHHGRVPSVPGLPSNYFASAERKYPTRIAYGVVRNSAGDVISRPRPRELSGPVSQIGAGSLPGRRADIESVEPLGQFLACAYRRQIEIKNIYKQYQAENKSKRVYVVNRNRGSGQPSWDPPGASWEKIDKTRCSPGGESNWPMNQVSSTKSECWYSIIYPSTPTDGGLRWNSWQREGNTRCSPEGYGRDKPRMTANSSSVCFWRWRWSDNEPTGAQWSQGDSPIGNSRCEARDNGMDYVAIRDPGTTCWFRWGRQWRYGIFPNRDGTTFDLGKEGCPTERNPDGVCPGQKKWLPAWPDENKGFVFRGSWQLANLYGDNLDTPLSYLQPGYSRIAPSEGYRSGSGMFEANICPSDWQKNSSGIMTCSPAEIDVANGFVVKTTPDFISVPWNLRATFQTRANVPWNYETKTVNSGVSSGLEQYVRVLAPRFAG